MGYRVSLWGTKVSGNWAEVVNVLNATQSYTLNKRVHSPT